MLPTFAVLAALGAPLVTPLGEPPLPRPGSARTVTSLVLASHRIRRLPNNLFPNLAQAFNDDTGAYYPATSQGCGGVNSCVFGDATSKTTVVLFGDSHAYMWLPALVAFADQAWLRLVLVWLAGCPAAWVASGTRPTNERYTSCNTFRIEVHRGDQEARAAARAAREPDHADRGTERASIAQSTWERGLERRSRVIRPGDEGRRHRRHHAVLGLLPDCLAAEPTTSRRARPRDPNTKIPGHYAAEQAAAHRGARALPESAALALHEGLLAGHRQHGRVLQQRPRHCDVRGLPRDGLLHRRVRTTRQVRSLPTMETSVVPWPHRRLQPEEVPR